ncbi:acyl-CoA dehydrogenase family protein [Subtercola sp. RTI3]|uniref:acyl-CoA dehydrogenase family protein n=1 Tax=Subtercola sp. RTI3 TaxID=3048639 RepID=UPI002B236194|nr:acyl-CoA dehydrogenase family protein [Subtercola sp. RTI3]MEA9983871.1 acyl-CoA dehydrogenase family protein [Subtercola sp. RTI3]
MTEPFVPVSLSPSSAPGALPSPWPALAALRLPSTVAEALAFAEELSLQRAVPGDGRTRELFEALGTLACHDLAVARAAEPHLDAHAILRQSGIDPGARGTWGVFASEGGEPLVVERSNDTWQVTGTKQWCSLAGQLDMALVTATVAPEAGSGGSGSGKSGSGGSGSATGPGERRLFGVRLRDPGITVERGAWHARGLTEVESGPVHFDRVDALPIGAPGWYLERPGFSWGAIAVAACWFGGAVGLARTLFEAVSPSASPFALMHLGRVDALLEDSRRALLEAAERIDDGRATGPEGRLLAKRVRATVARASEEILLRVGHALGPAPLALDAAHAKRVADLTLYLRQHHAEKDDASLGSTVAALGTPPW